MKKFQETLFKIDSLLSNYFAQAVLLCSIVLIKVNYPLWFYFGLISYICFWVFQIKKNKKYLKEVSNNKDYLGLLKGFTYIVILSPLAVPVYLLLPTPTKTTKEN